MIENRNHKSINRFFNAIALSLIILSIKVSIKKFTVIETIDILALTFLYIFTISIWLGLASMAIGDLYIEIKKKLKNGLILNDPLI